MQTEVVKMLASLGVAIEYGDNINCRRNLFVSFFLNKEQPENLSEMKTDVASCHTTTLALHTIIVNDAPNIFFSFILVKLYEKICRHLGFENMAKPWGQGMYVSLDEDHARLMMKQNDSNQHIESFIKGDAAKVEGHRFLF